MNKDFIIIIIIIIIIVIIIIIIIIKKGCTIIWHRLRPSVAHGELSVSTGYPWKITSSGTHDNGKTLQEVPHFVGRRKTHSDAEIIVELSFAI